MSKILIFDNVACKDYGKPALKNISFDIERGENIVVFGPENMGQHLLCPLIITSSEILEGDIRYNGSSIKGLDYLGKINYKKHLCYLPHVYGLFSNMTVEENIAMPLYYHSRMTNAEIKDYVDVLIGTLNLMHCRALRPMALNRTEMLKTAYARAVVFDPDLIMIEHAFDGQSYLQLLSFFDMLTDSGARREKSTLFITFTPQTFFRLADKFIMFFDNKIVFTGSADEYMRSDNPYVVQYRTLSKEGPMVFL